MLRCHRRSRPLRLVLQELMRYNSFATVKVHVLCDRTTTDVQTVLDEFKGQFWGLKHLDFPILGDRERFREAKELQFRILEAAAPDWVLLQDDDRWFEPLGISEELPRFLTQDDVDIVYARSWFVWDRPGTFNTARHHYSPVLFRYAPGLHYPLDRDIQVPLPLHDEAIIQGRAGEFETPLLDFGTFDERERKLTFEAFRAAGKDDHYVNSIVGPPDLKLIDEELGRPWHDLWTEEYGP